MATPGSLIQLDALCRERWPQIMGHCPESDPAQRVLFCLLHAGLWTSTEMNAAVLTPHLIADLTERVRSSPAARDSDYVLSSSLSLFSDIASADTVRTSLTGPQLTFPFDVVVGGARDVGEDVRRLEISKSTVQALEQELGGLRDQGLYDQDATRPGGSMPDYRALIDALPRLLDTVRAFRDVFATSLSSVLQSNAPLLRLQPSPVGEQLGRTACDLRQHLDTFTQLIESVRAVRHGLGQLKAKSASDSAAPGPDQDSVARLRRQVRILQTALGQYAP